MMIVDDLLERLNKIEKRLDNYNRKKGRMGLTKEETKKVTDLFVEKFEVLDLINDNLFNTYIYDKIRDELTDKVFERLGNDIGWNGEVIIDIESVCNKVDELGKEKLCNIKNVLKALEEEIISRTIYYYESEDSDGREMLDYISDVISVGKKSNLNGLIDFIEYKFQLLYMCIGEVN